MHIQHNVHLQPYNTFHFDCVAAYFVEIEKSEDLQELLQTDVFKNNPHLILGGGSNILLTQDRYAGLVIKNNILGKETLHEDETSVTLKVGAGENWNDFVRRSIAQGYCGIENLVSIPGTVGAAPMQNIGAYGIEAKAVIDEVQYSNLEDGKSYVLSNNECYFGYRSSVFKQNLKDKTCITQVTFTLSKYVPDTYQPRIAYGAIEKELHQQGYKEPWDTVSPEILATTIAAIRASKLPDRHTVGTAGSFFKNPIITQTHFEDLHSKFPDIQGYPIPHSGLDPESPRQLIKLSAGQLIDLAGCKGITEGKVGTYKNHALVLVHHGGGKGKDILELATHIQKQVYDTFGVSIEPEVNYV